MRMRVEYLLKDYPGGVPYIMKQGRDAVKGAMPFDVAKGIMDGGTPRISNEFEGYPITADGVYFFTAMYRIYDKQEGSNDA